MKLAKVAVLPVILATIGCSQSWTDGMTAGEQSPLPAGVAGVYRLYSVNDQALPALVGSWDDCREHLVSAALTLRPDGQYLLTATARQQCGGAEPIESRGRGAQGRFAVQGDSIRFDDEPTPLAAATEPGWVEDHPGRRFAVEELGSVGLLDRGFLTLRLEDGGIATFRKDGR